MTRSLYAFCVNEGPWRDTGPSLPQHAKPQEDWLVGLIVACWAYDSISFIARRHSAAELSASHYPGPVGSDGSRGRGGEQENPGIPGLHTKNVFTAADTGTLLPGVYQCEPRCPLPWLALAFRGLEMWLIMPREQHSEWSTQGWHSPRGLVLAGLSSG